MMKLRREYRHLDIPDTADVTKGVDESNFFYSFDVEEAYR